MASTSTSATFSSLAGKVVIITGSSSGIGAGAAVKFARLGCCLCITGRNEGKLEQVKQKCFKMGLSENEVLCCLGVITEEQCRKTMVEKTVGKFGKINVLVNNAGIVIPGSPVPGVDLADFDTLFNVNVKSVVALRPGFSTHLDLKVENSVQGNIVNVSSIAGAKAMKNRLFYCMSKAAVDMFTRCMALDMARHGVRVNSVNPGVIPTSIHSRRDIHATEASDKEFFDAAAAKHPMGRNGSVEEVANAIAFLSSDEASYVNGDLLKVDGGLTC